MDKNKLTYDYIAGTDIYLWQRKDMFRINTDTAQLAQFMKVKKGERVLDVGTNNGALLLAAERSAPSYLCGVDIQEEACALARFNMQEHGIDHAEIRCEDFSTSNLRGFDVVLCNPPYFQQGHHGEISVSPKAIARHEFFLRLDVLIANVARSLKENGRFYLVHRSERIPDILEQCQLNRLEVKTMQLMFDEQKEYAVGVLIEAILGANRLLRVPQPVFIRR
ncbi:MAG TPA: methyltransferase domain-containing protein [Candidatus Merdibacter merdavium]|uniref:Methyltransferase domain-containing protein n=1 Tax=Candidatus Merdibacter merdavium TaxID=2838692 RepID=A0A9D2NTR7_9FIRM|nr:methyltransferase domain-containing protein [Candidatus Merdibacter merdavium]